MIGATHLLLLLWLIFEYGRGCARSGVDGFLLSQKLLQRDYLQQRDINVDRYELISHDDISIHRNALIKIMKKETG